MRVLCDNGHLVAETMLVFLFRKQSDGVAEENVHDSVLQGSISTSLLWHAVRLGTAATNAGSMAAKRSRPCTLFVKKEGGAVWAEVTVKSSYSVARVKKIGVNELKSLQSADLDSLTVYKAEDTDGKVLLSALDDRLTVEAAGLTDNSNIVVKGATLDES